MTTMSNTTPASHASTPATTAQGVSTVGSQQIAGDFNTFLQLLTTQLQNQNPLDPLDTNQFTSQLVQFASVEQQINMNTNLQTLIALQQNSETAAAMQLLGTTVTLKSNSAALTQETPAMWTLSSPSPSTANVTITTATGQVAFTGTVTLNAGTQTYTWNGQGNNGVSWPPGNYNISISATGANGQPVNVTSEVQGLVSGIDLSKNPVEVIVGGQDYPLSAILSISK